MRQHDRSGDSRIQSGTCRSEYASEVERADEPRRLLLEKRPQSVLPGAGARSADVAAQPARVCPWRMERRAERRRVADAVRHGERHFQFHSGIARCRIVIVLERIGGRSAGFESIAPAADDKADTGDFVERTKSSNIICSAPGGADVYEIVTKAPPRQDLPKCPSGIHGLDQITGGGLPRGRPTLICGGAGCGKTLMAVEFLVHGATRYGEPGVFVTFEETADELAQNVRSLGYDLKALEAGKSLVVDYVRVERSEIEEMDGYDLEGLFIRLNLAIDSIGARRVVLDTIETLFGGFDSQAILRAELRRLFRWLKDRGVTAFITGERGEGTLTRHGLEEYVSDCVIMLDHRVDDQVSTRRLRIVKYRGSCHGTNEYPFLIDEDGITVLPITSLELDHVASDERVPTGIAPLDEMLDGGGYFRGSTILVSGTAGTGKTSVAAHLASATCERGEKCLYFAFEEARSQYLRNMRSIGLDLAPYVDRGLLHFHASRPTLQGLELHLVKMHKLIRDVQPAVVIVDPISNFLATGSADEANAMLTRLIDYLKMNGITALLTNLTSGNGFEQTEVNISSIVDTWLLLRDIELDGERNRAMYILKSRGMAHSNQLREFLITDNGVNLVDVYVGSEGVLTGSARISQEAREEEGRLARRQELDRHQRELDRKRRALDTQITALRHAFEVEEDNLKRQIEEEEARQRHVAEDRAQMARRRRADGSQPPSDRQTRKSGIKRRQRGTELRNEQ